jgi:2-polyprenyl-3-methyl-5-hydroxy-6-metoxy-1,4-benzoquinol methylase
MTNKYEQRRLFLIANLVRGNNVLDIGYASLPNPHLTKFSCTGYDLVKPINPSGYHKESQGDVKDIKKILRNKKFDTIICGELIEHLENPYQFLRDIHTLLEKSGLIIISTPNPLSFPVIFFEILQNKRFYFTESHKYYFLPRWVERMLNQSGYQLVKKKAIGIWLPFVTLPYCPKICSYQLIYVGQKIE